MSSSDFQDAPAEKSGKIKRFRDEQQKEGAFEYRDRGQQTVALSQIVGSVNRYLDFDSRFRLKRDRPRERLLRIRRMMEQGRPLPPVNLYKIKDEYFVVDGNYRISAAKERGFEEINARVIEFLPSRGTAENVLYRERSEFEEKSGLRHSIALTEPNQYRHLLRQVTGHRQYLEEQARTAVPLEEAAEDWYRTIYQPLTAMLEKAGLLAFFRKRTVSDLYAYISVHQWERSHSRSFGSTIDRSLARSMEEFRESMRNVARNEYPSMLREITVFVLITITARKECQILEKLFSLDEVKEVHSVHGSIDVIAKLVLSRNLASSDAEVIGRYVRENIHHIRGILSTQTLIPGLSKIKADKKAT